MNTFLKDIPKGENHYHFDSIPPELAWRFAQRNHVDVPFSSLDEAREFYRFKTLEEFINVLLVPISTIRTSRDFEEIIVACAEDMVKQNIVYREAMFDFTGCFAPQNITIEEMVSGLEKGVVEAKEKYNRDIRFIANIDRTADVRDNCRYLEELALYKEKIPIVAVGLDMMEVGFPASRQKEAFKLARELGFYTTAHAGEDAGPESIIDTLEGLEPDRLDHGIRAVEDPGLVRELADRTILLTLCPDSNISLSVYPSWEEFPIMKLLEAGVKVSINSDDPPCFRHDLTGNLIKIAETFSMSQDDMAEIVRNAFKWNFCGQEYVDTVNLWLEEDNYLNRISG